MATLPSHPIDGTSGLTNRHWPGLSFNQYGPVPIAPEAFHEPKRDEPQALTGQARAAIVFFARTADAEALVAGVPAAARVIHSVRLGGAAACRLELGDGGAPSEYLRTEINRLAENLQVDFGSTDGPATGDAVQRIDGSDLPTPEQVKAVLIGGGSISSRDPGARDICKRFASQGREIVRSTAKPGDGIISRTINRPISQAISAQLLRIRGIRPTHATLGTALLALAMFGALVLGTRSGQVWGALLFQFASIFDGVDGEIARATFQTSRDGARLDSLIDAITNIGFIFGLTVNLALQGESRPAEAGVVGMVLLGAGLTLIGRASVRSGQPFGFDVVKHHYRIQSGGRPLVFMRAATFITSRDFFALVFAIAILAGLAGPMLELFAVSALLWFGAVVRALTAERL